jgi:hypothetical protein
LLLEQELRALVLNCPAFEQPCPLGIDGILIFRLELAGAGELHRAVGRYGLDFLGQRAAGGIHLRLQLHHFRVLRAECGAQFSHSRLLHGELPAQRLHRRGIEGGIAAGVRIELTGLELTALILRVEEFVLQVGECGAFLVERGAFDLGHAVLLTKLGQPVLGRGRLVAQLEELLRIALRALAGRVVGALAILLEILVRHRIGNVGGLSRSMRGCRDVEQLAPGALLHFECRAQVLGHYLLQCRRRPDIAAAEFLIGSEIQPVDHGFEHTTTHDQLDLSRNVGTPVDGGEVAPGKRILVLAVHDQRCSSHVDLRHELDGYRRHAREYQQGHQAVLPVSPQDAGRLRQGYTACRGLLIRGRGGRQILRLRRRADCQIRSRADQKIRSFTVMTSSG